MKRWLYRTFNRNWWQIVAFLTTFIIILLALLAMSGCSEASRFGGTGGSPAPTPCADLLSLGRTLIWVGGICLVLGVFARVAFAVSFLNPAAAILSRIPGIAGIAIFIAEGGAVSLICGLILSWLAANFWVVIAACGLACLAWAYHRRVSLNRWFSHLLGKGT